MGTMTIIMIALTAVALLFGMLYGLGRGRNRSILRLILIIGCIAGAIYLRQPVIEFLLDTDMAKELLASLAKEVPENFQLVFSILLNLILSIAVYFVLFFVLRIVSWLIIFPIFKIFVKTEVDKRRGFGALIGLVQGIVVALAVLVPLNGLVMQVDRLSKVEMVMPSQNQGGSGGGEQTGNNEPKPLFVIPENIGLNEYASSDLANIYNTAGGWYFDMITTVETSEGDLNFNDVCDVVVGMVDVMDATTDISEGFQTAKDGKGTKEETATALRDIGADLNDIGLRLNKMKKPAKALLDILFSSMFENQQVDSLISNLKLDSLGNVFISLGDFYEDGIVERQAVENIVNGLVDNWSLLELMNIDEAGLLCDMEGSNEDSFVEALQGVETEKANVIRTLFGIGA